MQCGPLTYSCCGRGMCCRAPVRAMLSSLGGNMPLATGSRFAGSHAARLTAP